MCTMRCSGFICSKLVMLLLVNYDLFTLFDWLKFEFTYVLLINRCWRLVWLSWRKCSATWSRSTWLVTALSLPPSPPPFPAHLRPT